MSAAVSLRWGSATDTGRVRTVNQDSSLVADPVFAVADGMGGHAAGEVASQVAVESMRDNATPSRQGLVDAVRLANRAVIDRADDDPELRGMGTTLCAIALADGPGDDLDGPHVVVANVGDSRVYLFRDDDLLQLTDDHSFVEELVRQGRLTPEEARVHPQKNIVTRVLGNEPDVAVDTWEVDPYRGDRFLLCSDGLFNEADDDLIAGVLRRVDDPDDVARELVRLANEHGGRDNITVVVVDVVDDGGRSRSASAALAGEPGTTARRSGPGAGATGGLGGGAAGGTATATAAPPRRAGDVPPATSVEHAPKPRRVTLRSVTFVFAVLLVLGAAVGSVYWFSRSAYFVGLDDEEIAIYQGRPGGVLWIEPTMTERTGLTLDDVPPARHADLAAGKEETSLEAARRYVGNLEAQGAELERRASATTTTAPTTTTDPATPADPTAGTGTGASPTTATP